jgi:hypothetical protein
MSERLSLTARLSKTRLPNVSGETLPPALIDRFRRDYAACVPLEGELEDCSDEKIGGCANAVVEARLAFYAPA